MIKIVVLDTGFDCNSSCFVNNIKDGVGFYENENHDIVLSSNFNDDIGHGTAVATYINSMISKSNLTSSVEIIPIKIMSNAQTASTQIMLKSLNYIYENVECDIINISVGIVSCENIDELYECCFKLMRRGTIIISAYDNGGARSFPAAFDCVIGVDGKRQNWGHGNYKSVNNNNADFVGVIKEVRSCFLNGQYNISSGNSFLAPEFVVKVAEIIQEGKRKFDDVVSVLNKGSIGTIEYAKYKISGIDFKINRAIVFPFNKEMHSIARFEDMLNFEVCGYYDTKFSRNIGKSMSKFGINNPKTIKSINKLDWNDDFDTVILGHTSILSDAIGIDFESEIISNCIKYNKKLFSCHDIRENLTKIENSENLTYYSPYVDKFQKSDFLKMNVMGCPVLGIVGTGGSQGKFTMQLGLRRELLHRGFRVSQLGTEPTALLFGMDCVYPMGHESSVYLKGFDAIIALNNMLGYMESQNPDIIIFGSQANTVPFHVGGPQDYPIVQHELILGCQSDAYILCVSNDATLPYIKRTISYLEGVYNSKVICIVLSVLSIGARWSTISSNVDYMSQDEIDKFEEILNSSFDIPIIKSNDANFYKKIADIMISYFSN